MRKLGIIGAGAIAHSMCKTIQEMEGYEVCAIASRSLEKAKAFANIYNIKEAYGDYEEMLMKSDCELVYIATPHSHHFEHMKLCIKHHKNILCEKAFTLNGKQAKEIKELALRNNVFVSEALWPRYMPSRQMINDLIQSGMIGEISMVTCNLSYDIDEVERIIRPELAGGALLDIGVYGLNFILMHIGKNIKRIESAVSMTDTGVDGKEVITLFFDNDIMATTSHSIYCKSDRKGIFSGDKGYMIVDNINNPGCIDVFDLNDKLVKHYDVPEQISGYEYQVIECFECIEKKEIESISMPLDESIYLMELMDRIRISWNLKYPEE